MSGPISFTVRPPSAPHRPSPLGNGGHRSGPPSRRLFEHGNDEDHDHVRESHRNSHRSRIRDERVDGFRNGRSHGYVVVIPFDGDRGADDFCRELQEEPLVIPALPNTDWRQTAQRRTPTYRPESRQPTGEVVTHERNGDGPQRSGIRQVVKVETTAVNGDNVIHRETMITTINGEPSIASTSTAHAEPAEMTLEQRALAELLAGDPEQQTAEERAQRELIIAMQEGRTMTEDEAFKRDVDVLPEESTLEDYEAIPVSAFGLAMVRGMGYDPKSAANTAIHEPKSRPQLLGLGATPMDASIRPTHAKRGSAKDRQAERKAKTGRGFNASNLLIKQEREGSSSVTPSGSRLTSPDGSEKRRRRDDDSDYESGRDIKRERNGDNHGSRNGDDHRSRNGDDRDRARPRDGYDDRERDRERSRRQEYESEEERARRKTRERRDRDREYETEDERARRKDRERRDRERDRAR